MDLVHLQRTGQGTRVGQTADPAPRVDAAGEVPGAATGSLAQLGVGGHQDRLGDRKPELPYQPLEGPLVMQTGQRAKRRGEHLGGRVSRSIWVEM